MSDKADSQLERTVGLLCVPAEAFDLEEVGKQSESKWAGLQGWVTGLRDERPGLRHHSRNRSCPMLRLLSVGLLASAIALAPFPAKAQDGTAEDLGDVMSISLKDLLMTTLADQCALRVANAGSGVFGWLEDAANDQAVGNALFYDEFLDTRLTADFSWRFGINGLEGNQLDGELSGDLHSSSLRNHSEKVRHLYLCLAGMSQPVLLPPLPLPPLKE